MKYLKRLFEANEISDEQLPDWIMDTFIIFEDKNFRFKNNFIGYIRNGKCWEITLRKFICKSKLTLETVRKGNSIDTFGFYTYEKMDFDFIKKMDREAEDCKSILESDKIKVYLRKTYTNEIIYVYNIIIDNE